MYQLPIVTKSYIINKLHTLIILTENSGLKKFEIPVAVLNEYCTVKIKKISSAKAVLT